MDLLEYQGKKLFEQAGLAIPQGKLANTPAQAEDLAREYKNIVIKAQIPLGHRGKTGGIAFADRTDAAEKTRNILNKNFQGFSVQKVLVEKKVEIKKELYLALILNRQERNIELLFSAQGGIDIEELSKKGNLLKLAYPLSKKSHEQFENYLKKYPEINARILPSLNEIIGKLYDLMLKRDALLVEINPLAITGKDDLLLIDSKISIDDNALFRQPEFTQNKEEQLAYVPLNGNIAVIGNGAGLVMATLDLLEYEGGSAANFLDIGGGAKSDKMEKALAVVLAQKNVKGLLINIFGGITRTDEVAQGLVNYKKQQGINVPLVVRLVGRREKIAQDILKKAKIAYETDMQKAAQLIIKNIR